MNGSETGATKFTFKELSRHCGFTSSSRDESRELSAHRYQTDVSVCFNAHIVTKLLHRNKSNSLRAAQTRRKTKGHAGAWEFYKALGVRWLSPDSSLPVPCQYLSSPQMCESRSLAIEQRNEMMLYQSCSARSYNTVKQYK